MKRDRKEYIKAYNKTYRQSHKEKAKKYMKKYWKAHKEKYNVFMKSWRDSNLDKYRDYQKEYQKYYNKLDVNSLGESKNNIRNKSKYILKKMKLKIPGYEIHHCFGYNDPTKFIYISKSLHLKIHQFLRDNNIAADSDHWMQIRDMVLHCNEYFYAKI